MHTEKKELLFELGFLQGVPPQLWEETVTPTQPQKETESAEDKTNRSPDRVCIPRCLPQPAMCVSCRPLLGSMRSTPGGCTGRLQFSSVQFSSVAQSCPTLCDPMSRSPPGLPVHHQLPEFTQTHVHRVSDAIQPSHPLSPPSPPTFSLSQHQGLFQ